MVSDHGFDPHSSPQYLRLGSVAFCCAEVNVTVDPYSVSYDERKTLFIFLDESGNLDFSEHGTRYFSLTALCTFEPANGRDALMHLHYSLADSGICLECFHATENKQDVRDKVFTCISLMPDQFHVHTVIAEKSKAHPSLYRKWIKKKGQKMLAKDETRFYDLLCRTLLKFIFSHPRYDGARRIVVMLSSIFTHERMKAIEGTLKARLHEHTDVPFSIFFRSNKSDLNCQIADYCGWAIFIKWERDERRSYDLICNRLKSEFEIFRLGEVHHYKAKSQTAKA